MGFYTSVLPYGNNILLRGYEDDGRRVETKIPYKPTLFLPSKQPTGWTTLEGRHVSPEEFPSIRDAREFIKRYEGTENFPIYGLTNFHYAFINEYYPGEIQYDINKMSIVTIDIETDSSGGFPNIETANKEVVSIALRRNEKSIILGLKEYTPESINHQYIQCSSERELLMRFIDIWRSPDWNPDIITGWNIEFFDMPYLINRIRNLFDDATAKRLSPFNIFETRRIELMGKDIQVEVPAGVAVLDYLQLYKKFSFQMQESYKLDHIAFVVLGERKLDYGELGFESLADFYEGDFRNFINYNIRDVDLVYRLEEKLKLIEQVMAIAYDGKVNLIDSLTTVRMWDVIIHNYLYERKIVIPQFNPARKDRGIEGAYVKDPQVGQHKWVVSFDLNSLYPHLIMQYNISPETLYDQLEEYSNDTGEFNAQNPNPSVGNFIAGAVDRHRDDLVANNLTITPTGCLFRRDEKGFLPTLMEKMYDDRSVWKKRMLEAKKHYEQEKSKKWENEIARCHNMQLAKKIQLNSAYGALSNAFFRWFDPRLAESITKSGQLSIRWMEKHLNVWLNKQLGTTDHDYVLAIDTDSLYVTLDKFVDKVYQGKEMPPTEKIVEMLDKACSSVFEPFIDKTYDKLAVYMNAYAQKMKMKREAIANKGIWTGKKHYILNVWDLEGVRYKEPKLKIQGIEAVRSSTPQACRDYIKEALTIIMDKDEESLQQFIVNCFDEFKQRPFEEIAFPRSVRGLSFTDTIDPKTGTISQKGYASRVAIYSKGTPIHVKGALLYNHALDKLGLTNKYEKIGEGEKIKFSYLLVPNPLNDTVISTPGKLPKEFDLERFVDYSKQFEKSFVEPIRTITNVIGWQTEKQMTLEDFFS